MAHAGVRQGAVSALSDQSRNGSHCPRARSRARFAATWEAAQLRLETNRGQDNRDNARPYLLRGAIRCTSGQPMRTSPEHGKRTYRCASRETARAPAVAAGYPLDECEASAWAQIAAVLRDPSIIAAEYERQRAAGPGHDAARRQSRRRARPGPPGNPIPSTHQWSPYRRAGRNETVARSEGTYIRSAATVLSTVAGIRRFTASETRDLVLDLSTTPRVRAR